MDITEPNHRGLSNAYDGVTYGSPLTFGGVKSEDLRPISSNLWFTRSTIDEDEENSFNQLSP